MASRTQRQIANLNIPKDIDSNTLLNNSPFYHMQGAFGGVVPPSDSQLLLENGFSMLLEDGGLILLEG